MNGSWICFTVAIKCSDTTIDSMWKMIVFEPRYMIYRFVSQFVALHFFLLCFLTFGYMHKLMNTDMNICVLMGARAHLWKSEDNLWRSVLSFYYRQQAAIPTESSYKPSSIFSKLNYFLINVKIMSSIVPWVDSLFRNMANHHHYIFPW